MRKDHAGLTHKTFGRGKVKRTDRMKRTKGALSLQRTRKCKAEFTMCQLCARTLQKLLSFDLYNHSPTIKVFLLTCRKNTTDCVKLRGFYKNRKHYKNINLAPGSTTVSNQQLQSYILVFLPLISINP